jgi:hypothetical protein
VPSFHAQLCRCEVVCLQLGAVSEIDVDFAAVWCAVDKEVGGSGLEDWWSGRGAAWRAIMCKGA